MKKNSGDIIAKAIMLLTGAAYGVMTVLSSDFETLMEKGIGSFALFFAAAMLLAWASAFIQTIIHEGGHLIFGLFTGYKFISFRIGHFMFLKKDGMLRIKIFNVVGTAGQCLMMPPAWRADMPYRLYNLGGCIANAVTAAFSLLLYLAAGRTGLFSLFAVFLAVTGFSMALTNGIPMRVGGIANDGLNAAILGRGGHSLRDFWLQLYVNGLITKGERYRNMPEEWFRLPEGEELSDPISCTVGVMLFNYYLDRREFEKAEKTAEYMIKAPGILGVQKNELLCELLFLRILRFAPSAEIDPLLTPQLDRYIKATASYVSRRRLAYAYQLLYKKNLTMAKKCLEVFERTAATYPYAAEIESERELIEIINSRSEISE